jgi:hypothetical protein
VVVVVWGGQKQKPTIGGHEREDSNHFAHKPLPLFFSDVTRRVAVAISRLHPQPFHLHPFFFFFLPFHLGKKPTAIYILVTP